MTATRAFIYSWRTYLGYLHISISILFGAGTRNSVRFVLLSGTRYLFRRNGDLFTML